ncbi:MAG: hypothetical protein HYR85_09935 [Planctomycetes bacterium]|nr:hypothetical protein [Planctomycetota bacterium]
MVFDDGSGPALYAGGEFGGAGDVSASSIARWNGTSWSAVGDGLSGQVQCLSSYDDGTGHPVLVAGGRMHVIGDNDGGYIAMWDGSAWTTVGDGFLFDSGYRTVNALATFVDATGPFLLAGGDLTFTFGGTPITNLAKWNGHSWSTFAGGTDGPVNALGVFDFGSGPSVYVAGGFSHAGGVSTPNIARWNGHSWSALGSGLPSTAYGLGVFDDGSGRKLYSGGSFTSAGGTSANHIARWDGTRWSALGGGILGAPTVGVLTMTGFDDGNGARLFVGGVFWGVGNEMPAQHFAWWDGIDWQTPDTAFDMYVVSLAEFDDGTGPAVFAGGYTQHGPGSRLARLVKVDHGALALVSSNVSVNAMATFDDGSGPALYVGGRFTDIGGVSANHIARWNGHQWSALDVGTDDVVYALAVHDDGTGRALYVGGEFANAGGLATGPIAKWNGLEWSTVGTPLYREARAFASFDDGNGPALYAAGRLQPNSSTRSRSVFKWDGSVWTNIGAPYEFGDGVVNSLVGLDDGTGPALFAGGSYPLFGGPSAPVLGRWSHETWSDLTYTLENAGSIAFLAAFDAGNGPRLYAAGHFYTFVNPGAGNLAQWNGSTWSSLDGNLDADVNALLPSQADGTPGLVVGGLFTLAGGTVSSRVAKWEVTPRRGNVNDGAGSISDVLFVNDSSGGTERTVSVRVGQRINVSLDAAPAGSGRGHYVVWGWANGPSNPVELRVGGQTIGCMIAPSPFHSGLSPQPVICLRGVGVRPQTCRGVLEIPSPPRVPLTVRAPGGRHVPTVVTLQGVVEDEASTRSKRVSVTNAVVLRVE